MPNESVEDNIPSGFLLMRFLHYKRIGRSPFDILGEITYDKPVVMVNQGVMIEPSDFLSNRGLYTKKLKKIISSYMPGVPEYEHPAIIAKAFEVVQVAVLGLLIDVVTLETTVRILGCATTVEEHHKIVDGVTMEFMHLTKHIAATKISIDVLEKVTGDSLDLTVRQITHCIICREDLDDDTDVVVEERTVHPLIIIRLPCSHLYHEDCIIEWLLINQFCPLCRYPILVVKNPCELPILEEAGEGPSLEGVVDGPIGEVTDEQPIVEVAVEQLIVEVADKQSKTTTRKVNWPMLLKMSAGGIITAMLLCRLLKQS